METVKRWKQERRSFLIIVTVLALVFYLALPFSLAFIPEKMQTSPIGSLSWAWILAFLQVGMTWLIGWIYWVKAKQLDKLVAEMKREAR